MKFLRAKRSHGEVIYVLRSILDRTLTDVEWDDFISVKIRDPKLEEVRLALEEMWTENSPFRIKGSIDPVDLNPKGVSRVQKLILDLQGGS